MLFLNLMKDWWDWQTICGGLIDVLSTPRTLSSLWKWTTVGRRCVKQLGTIRGEKRGFWWSATHFKVVYVCEEEEDEAEGRDPLAYRARQVKDVVLKIRSQKIKPLHRCKMPQV